MLVTITKKAGFCSGAKKSFESALSRGEGSFTLGEILHNANVIQALEKKGIKVAKDISSLPNGATVTIRAHGIPKEYYKRLHDKRITINDATCGSIVKIHKIVENHYMRGYKIILLGAHANHAETVGTNGWCGNEAIIIENDELENKTTEEIQEHILLKLKVLNK